MYLLRTLFPPGTNGGASVKGPRPLLHVQGSQPSPCLTSRSSLTELALKSPEHFTTGVPPELFEKARSRLQGVFPGSRDKVSSREFHLVRQFRDSCLVLLKKGNPIRRLKKERAPTQTRQRPKCPRVRRQRRSGKVVPQTQRSQ